MRTIIVSLTVYVAAIILPFSNLLAQDGPGKEWTPQKKTAARWVDKNKQMLKEASVQIWERAELALKESESSQILIDLLEDEGFDLQRGVSGMPTAFVASYGSGAPVVAYLAEYDALPGLSQKVTLSREARIPGGGGHGCGHNLFGVGSVGGAVALKEAMKKHDLRGTVRVYGTPAEEQLIGKVFMVRDGLFDDVDICLSWHPSDENKVNIQPSKALRSFEVTFYGRSAHASAAPWDGVSALDAVEAFEAGVNLLREHMPETARIHYVVTEGGEAPNVIPSRARAWLFTRGKDWPEEEKVYHHVLRIVEAADMMAWGEEYGVSGSGYQPVEIAELSGVYDYNINLGLARLVQRNLELVGSPSFSEEEQSFARQLQVAFDLEAKGMHTEVIPLDPNRAPEPGGSTDVANISWVAPTIGFGVANWPLGIPAHSWASTAASGSSAGLNAMLSAAKVMAFSGIDALTEEVAMKQIREEFEESRKKFDYGEVVSPDVRPSLPSHMK